MTDETALCSLRELYVLDGLTDEERRTFEAHLETCEQCQSEVNSLQPVQDWLLYDFEPADPPAGMKGRILSHVFAEASSQQPLQRQDAASPSDDGTMPFKVAAETGDRPDLVSPTRRRRGVNSWLAAAAAAAVVLVGVGTWAVSNRPGPLGPTTRSAQLVSTAKFPSSSARAYVSSGQDGNRLFIKFSGLQAVQGTQVYQVWLLNKGQPPVSMGVFTPSASGAAVFAGLLPSGTYTAVGITLEPKAVDKTPQGPLVMSATLSV